MTITKQNSPPAVKPEDLSIQEKNKKRMRHISCS
jgi:hypothetical protein